MECAPCVTPSVSAVILWDDGCIGHTRTAHASGHAQVAERQTRWLQVPVSERAWGFKSPLAHAMTNGPRLPGGRSARSGALPPRVGWLRCGHGSTGHPVPRLGVAVVVAERWASHWPSQGQATAFRGHPVTVPVGELAHRVEQVAHRGQLGHRVVREEPLALLDERGVHRVASSACPRRSSAPAPVAGRSRRAPARPAPWPRAGRSARSSPRAATRWRPRARRRSSGRRRASRGTAGRPGRGTGPARRRRRRPARCAGSAAGRCRARPPVDDASPFAYPFDNRNIRTSYRRTRT